MSAAFKRIRDDIFLLERQRIDHSILLTRLSSWFGFHGSALNWFTSYLSSRSFRVRCNNTFVLLYLLLWSPPRIRSWSSAFHHVHYQSQSSTLISIFLQPPPPLCRHSTIFLLSPTQLRLSMCFILSLESTPYFSPSTSSQSV